jgi:hypothetical protein
LSGDDLELLSFRAVARLLHRHHGRVTEMVRKRQLLVVEDDRGRVFVPRWAIRRWQEEQAGLVAPAEWRPRPPDGGPARRRQARSGGHAA